MSPDHPYDVTGTLKTIFGYDSFRPGQREVVDAILSGRDALAVMPTGAGKSICYQLPAMLLPGITLVVSPLISLMQDQVKALNDAGIHAAYINSSLTEGQIAKALRLATDGAYKIIYVAPERLETNGFLAFAQRAELPVSMVTVDEAHCVSQWGNDFRPSYRNIAAFIEKLPVRPVLAAFTATATPEVKEDISCMLELKHPQIVATGFDRANLYYSVEHIRGASKKDAFIFDYVERHSSESGIIYCATRKNVDALYEALFRRGVPVTRYHAGLDNGERKRNQEDFLYDRTPVVVATNAFGMGIDKSNVRYVIHYNMPQSMENYYQEAGRAGRDGEAARCILLFSDQDVMIAKYLLENKDFSEVAPEDVEVLKERDAGRLRAMERYARGTGCLRSEILSYFGEGRQKPCGNCGNCDREVEETDRLIEAKQAVNCVYEAGGRYGMNLISGILAGAKRARIQEIGGVSYRTYGALKELGEKTIQELLYQLIDAGILSQTEGRYSVIRLGDISALKGEDAHFTMRTQKQKADTEEKAQAAAPRKRKTDDLTAAGYRLFDRLRSVRTQLAREAGLPPYIVFNDKTLIDMSVRMPKNKTEFLQVSGVGAQKCAKYGPRFLAEIQAFRNEEGL